MGHDVVVLRREYARQRISVCGALTYYAKHIVKLALGKQSSWHYAMSNDVRNYVGKNTLRFIQDNLQPSSALCYSTEQLDAEVERWGLDAIIVGSDQVWRPVYSPGQSDYFFKFLPFGKKIRRISYAASFGVDECPFNQEEQRAYSELLKHFSAVSVREASAVGICRDTLKVEATLVLDPTMLLDSTDYAGLTAERQSRGKLFCYVLDRTEEKQKAIASISLETGLKHFEVLPELPNTVYNVYNDIEKCVQPPLESWLSAFQEAEMVITDSFHGTVFSIIFNKPFWVIGNPNRGMARFHSLLNMFGLEHRLVTEDSIADIDIREAIDWQRVNAKRSEMKQSSLHFLKESLA